ncbi:MAG: hypothetical protein HUJ59_04385 [Bacilli bacterium]|nr:hypothetical protein [Bacilli bacterium]
MIKKYRKKPVEIEAIQYTGKNDKEVISFIDDSAKMCQEWSHKKNQFKIKAISTLEGRMYISIGDFVIKGVNGEFYPCKPDIFEKTYDEVI